MVHIVSAGTRRKKTIDLSTFLSVQVERNQSRVKIESFFTVFDLNNVFNLVAAQYRKRKIYF